MLAITLTAVGCGGSVAGESDASNVAFAPASADVEAVPRSRLEVTEGRVEAAGSARRLRVEMGGMRAVVSEDSGQSAELAFVYEGPSAVEAPLARAGLRRQIGLKLRAQDSCNVVYVMWHVEPAPGIVVSVKRNAGASRHAECGANGYTTIRPQKGADLPPVNVGEPHTLRADLHGAMLTVLADGALLWEGVLPSDVLDFDGPAGLRSDNGNFDFELRVARNPTQEIQHF